MISNQLQHVVVQQNPQQADGMAPSCPHCPLRPYIRKSPLGLDKIFISITITVDSSSLMVVWVSVVSQNINSDSLICGDER